MMADAIMASSSRVANATENLWTARYETALLMATHDVDDNAD